MNPLVYTSHMEDDEKFITKKKKTQVRADSKIEFNFFK